MNAFTRTRDADAEATPAAPGREPARHGFRPVALPALAAALRFDAAARAARSERPARIVHEDEPTV